MNTIVDWSLWTPDKNNKTYYSHPSFSRCKLIKHQLEPSKQLADFLISDGRQNGVVVIGQTGCGKTYVMAVAMLAAQMAGKLVPNDNKPFQLHPVFVLAPTNVVTKHRRVFNKIGLNHVEVITGDSLRSSYGDNYITWTTRIVGERTEYDPVWIKDSMPDVILVDECQQYKNPNALRTKVLKAFVQQGGKVVFISATPFQKASEAELIAIGCGLAHTHRETIDYLSLVSGGYPAANSPTTVKRIQEDLKAKEAWISISGVRYPFKPVVKNYLLTLNPEKRIFYNRAYAEYQEERARAGKNPLEGVLAKWVAMQKFRAKSELLRADELAALGHHVNKVENRAIIIGSNFIPTLREAWNNLVRLGVNKTDISYLIGNQTPKEKQRNIDDFQSGRTNYFLTTLKSGGTGLDLHHEVVEAKPRTVILPPTWSCYEMIQVLGRAQRITNLSAVQQFICWYADTIEEEVADRLESKLSCLRELVERKDSFMMDIFNKEVDKDLANKMETDVIENEEQKDEEESLFDLDLLDGEK